MTRISMIHLIYLWFYQACNVEEDRSLALRIIQIGREVLFNSKISKASAHTRPRGRSYY
jgi:hypothetical protein